MSLTNAQSLSYIAPEIILGMAIVGLFVVDLILENKKLLGEIALLCTALTAIAVALVASKGQAFLFNHMIVHDPFGIFFKILFALSGIAAVWMSLDSNEVKSCTSQGEYFPLLLSSVLAMFFMASATNLLMAYLSLEFLSLTSYVLTGYLRHDRRSGEAALKYLIYGGVASGTMIFGMSWIFGLTGSMDFSQINLALTTGAPGKLALFLAILFTFAGLGYKISAAPFHMWAPDVYTGAPIPVTAFLSVGSKAAGFALTMRFLYPAISKASGDGNWQFAAGVDWPHLVLVLSAVTMTIGNLTALSQSNLKRLLAYSSIAHAGYMMMGLVVLTNEGLRAMMFYMAVYYLMNFGSFLAVMLVVNATGREDIDGLRGLAWRGGFLPAACLAVFLFSLTGLPPFAGFIGKFYLFAAVVRQQLYFLAVVGVLNSVVSLYYYARIVRTMFLDFPEGDEASVDVSGFNAAILGGLAALTIILGVYWAPLINFADSSIRFLQS